MTAHNEWRINKTEDTRIHRVGKIPVAHAYICSLSHLHLDTNPCISLHPGKQKYLVLPGLSLNELENLYAFTEKHCFKPDLNLLFSENNKILGEDTVSPDLTWKLKTVARRNISLPVTAISSIFQYNIKGKEHFNFTWETNYNY